MSLAISVGFLDQLNTLPPKARKRVNEFLVKFMAEPESPGINYELVKGSHHNSLHSARVDDDYRAIIGRPTKDAYMLLWVDKHDDAYHWAEGRRCEVNALTGALQIYAVESIQASQTTSHTSNPTGIFAAFKDKELLRLGVPNELLPVIREIQSDEELEQKLPLFPAEISDALYMMAAGTPYHEVLAQLEYPEQPVPVDTNDIAAALARMESQRQFRALESERELNEVLNLSFEHWKVFLHPSQRKLVERDWNGPVRILGGAGTGKTVAALHRARWLLQNRFTQKDDRILFTTFTKNLASDIRTTLERWIPELMDRLEVLHLDAWVARFFEENSPGWKLCFSGEETEHWKQALAEKDPELELDEAFYRDEWEQVVLAQGIDSQAEYSKVRRVGRGTSLNATQRKLVWKVFGAYRSALAQARLIEPDDAMRRVALLFKSKGLASPYKAILVDESQDLGFQAFRLLRSLAGPQHPNDLFLVGDPHQRIYGRMASLSASGGDIRGRGRKLRINYRTTEEIRKEAVQELQGIQVDDLDEGRDDNFGYHSLLHGPKPLRFRAKDFNQEVSFITEYLQKKLQEGVQGRDCCIACRTHEYAEQLAKALEQKGIESAMVQPEQGKQKNQGIRIATMHRVKGLEFEHMVIAGISEGRFPLPPPSSLDSMAKERWLSRERALLYVAMTRARKSVALTGW